MTGGVLSVMQGGKFGHGFLAAGFAKAFTPAIEAASTSASSIGNINVAEVAMAAAVGGTVSKISGGKFANGAATAAFANIFNN